MKTVSMNRSFLKVLTTGIVGVSLAYTPVAMAASIPSQSSSIQVATAFTDLTLPTLRRGDRGKNVQLLQRILLDNGFLGAAGKRLNNPESVAVDGVFGAVTESAVKDLQQRYKLPVTGVVNPSTWEVLDIQENPYHSPLPWKK